jgi:amino acid transporter
MVQQAGDAAGGEIQRLERGTLSLWEVIVGGLSQAAPALSLYFTTAVIAGVASYGVPLVYVIALAAIVLTAWSAGRFAGHFPSAGSMVTLVSNGIGPRAGIWTGLLTQFGYLLIIASVYVLWGLWINEILMRWFGIDIPWQLIMVVGAFAFLALMIVGIQVSMKATAVLFGFEFIVIFVLATVIVVQGGAAGNTIEPFTLGPDGMQGLWLGFVFAVFSYVGWEGSLSLAEEAKDPRHSVPIAAIFNILVLGGLYIFATYAVVIGFGIANMDALKADGAPFDTLAQQYTPALRVFVDIAGATSIAASALAATNNMARVLFNMGREGMIPRVLGSVHPRFKTPHVALTFYVVFSVVVCGVWGLFQDPLGVFGGVAGLGSIAVIPGYMLINISLIVYVNRHPGEFSRRWLYTIVPAVGVAVLAFPLYQITNPVGQSFPFNTFWLVILIVAVIAAVYTQLLVRSRPDIARSAGSILA